MDSRISGVNQMMTDNSPSSARKTIKIVEALKDLQIFSRG